MQEDTVIKNKNAAISILHFWSRDVKLFIVVTRQYLSMQCKGWTLRQRERERERETLKREKNNMWKIHTYSLNMGINV